MNRKNILKYLKEKIYSAEGTTMTEVLVAFIIVTMAFAMFSKIIVFSENMIIKFQEIQNNYETFNENYYRYKNDTSLAEGETTFPEEGRTETDGSTIKLLAQKADNSSSPFVLKLDEQMTDISKNKAVNITIELPQAKLYYYDDAKTGHGQYFFAE